MKKLLLLLIIPFLSFGQVNLLTDSLSKALKSNNTIELEQDIMRLQDDIAKLKYNLNAHHKSYMQGAGLQVLGLVLSGVALGGANDLSSGAITAISGAGFLSGIIGWLIMIDSDKWFQRDFTQKQLYLDLSEENNTSGLESDFSDIICDCNSGLQKNETSLNCQKAFIAYKINTARGLERWNNMVQMLGCK